MRTRAPGKLVLSGAYAVLEGAPALVASVDRYVTADTTRPASFVTPEVQAALGLQAAPWFDASPLRAGERKLGLGSSAAILVASLAAVFREKDPALDERALQASVFEPALEAHRLAQGGGSGIDVAASTYGGTLIVSPTGNTLSLQHATLPAELCIETWFSGTPATTWALIERVHALRTRDPRGYRKLIGVQADASARAVDAVLRGDAARFVRALAAQQRALFELGRAANAEIVTSDLQALHLLAERDGAEFLPSGAGGGDVAVHVAPGSSSEEFRQKAENLGYRQLEPLALSVRGVHSLPSAL